MRMTVLMRGHLLHIAAIVFAIGAVFGTISGISTNYILLIFFLGLLFFLLYLISTQSSCKTWMIVGATVCWALISGEVRAALAPHALPVAYKTFIASSTPISIDGTIRADPDIREKNQQLIVETGTGATHTNILVFAPLYQHFAYGERIQAVGALTVPAPFVTDNGRIFRYDSFLAKKGIFSLMQQASVQEIAPPSGLLSICANILFSIKHTFVEGLSRALPDPYAALATGLLTGDQHSLGDSLVTILSISGLIWIVVLSGYHVSLIAEGVLALSASLPKKVSYVLAGTCVLGVIFATGMSAPSLRGGFMACLTLVARATGRTYDALRALSAAVLVILLWNPTLIAYDAGFQLSVIVTPALLLAVPIVEQCLIWIRSTLLREIVSVSIVAQLACMPLILWQTGQIGFWAIPANMFVMSLVPFAMIASVLAGGIGILAPPLAPALGLPAFAILAYILTIARIAARLPFAGITIAALPFAFLILMYAALIWLLMFLKKCAARRLRSEIASR